MSTFGELVASIHSALHSYTGLHEQVTWLTSPVDASTLTLPVAASAGVMRGVSEIEDELVYVASSDAGSLQLAPFGRGYKGSTAAAHTVNAPVVFDPAFPKVEIKRAVNQVVSGLFPQIYRIRSTSLTWSTSTVGYELPADAEAVLEVKQQVAGVTNDWEQVSNWDFDPTSTDTSGRTLRLTDDSVWPNSALQVVYQARFGSLSADADTLAAAGIPESCADLILYGVTARMIRFLDSARLQSTSVENLVRSTNVQAGDAGRVANQLYAMYQQRLTEERSRLLTLTPARMHFTR